jgi:hypothetical protein
VWTGVAALVVTISLGSGLAAAPPQSTRFLDRLFSPSRPADRPQPLIPVPLPAPASLKERNGMAARLEAAIQPKEPASPDGQLTNADLPSWDEVRRFAVACQAVAMHVTRSALDDTYEPATRPLFQPILDADTKASAKASGRVVAKHTGSGKSRQVQAGIDRPVEEAADAAATGATNPYAAKRPSGQPPPRSQRLDRLRSRIAQTLAAYQRRPLNTAQHSPWEIMHGFIGFGIPTQIRVGGPGGQLANAIGWMNAGGRCRGQVMLVAGENHPRALYGVGVQGHAAQYLAILAQCRVAANSPIALGGREFTVADLVEDEKLNCRPKTELTFALIGLAHYLQTDTVWQSRDGQTWSLERLMAEEIEQPIRTAPCGGTHRLFGLAYGCQRRLKAVGSLDGVYARADKYVREYQQFTMARLQNRDGSFSTEWFKYPADREDDIDRKIQTTGHILEWLVASLDQERLYQPQVMAAAEFLATALARETSRAWKIGPLGHALHALNIYQERVWGVVLPGNIAAFHGPMKAANVMVAERPSAAGSSRR